MKTRAVIVDLDGTLCNIDHRLHYFDGPEKGLDKFFQAMPNDSLNEWCWQLIKAMENFGHQVIYVSGRPDSYRKQTEDWLTKNVCFNKVLMRKSGDFRPDAEVKEEIYREFIEPSYDVIFVVDDRQQVVDKWREMGLTCLQCAKGDY